MKKLIFAAVFAICSALSLPALADQASIISAQNFTAVDAGITENGTYRLYTSQKITVPNSGDSLEAMISYANNLPYPGGTQLAAYKLTAIIETQDSAGNWHVFHNQFVPYIKTAPDNILRYSPSVFTLDPGVAVDMWDGVNVFAREHNKQGQLPDDFRFVILVHELGFGGPGAFQSVDLSISYETYNSQ